MLPPQATGNAQSVNNPSLALMLPPQATGNAQSVSPRKRAFFIILNSFNRYALYSELSSAKPQAQAEVSPEHQPERKKSAKAVT